MTAATKSKKRAVRVSFAVSEDDAALIAAIARRAVGDGVIDLDGPWDNAEVDPQTSLEMDLTAVHANDGALDLESLVTLPGFDFTHDVCGIITHIDRRTGRLRGHFEPRCGRRKPV